MNRFLRPGLLLLFLMAPGLAANSQAGVVLTESEGSQTFISNGKFKEISTEDDQPMILDLKNGLVTMLDNRKKVFAKGTVDQFCSELSAMVGAAMQGMSAEGKAMMQQSMNMPGQQKTMSPPKVRVTKVGSGGKIAGLSTTEYLVTVNGEKYEQVWITEDASIMKELGNMDELAAMMVKMTDCMGQGMGMGASSMPESTPQYQELFKKGYPVKIISYEGGMAVVDSNVTKVEKRSISDQEFLPPRGFKKVSFSEMMGGSM